MSTLKDPVGPHSKKIYLRRRLILLAILISIPIIVLLIIFRPGSTGGVSDRKEVTLPSDLAADGKTNSKSSESDTPGCKKGDINVTAVANKASYAPGENPEIWMTISNSGTEPCVIDLGTKELSFEITSGSETYWSSTDCQTGADSREVILEPGNPLSTEPLVWDRTRSSPETCNTERAAVPADGAAYHLFATANAVKSSESWQFLLY